jgi:hypothetical protein
MSTEIETTLMFEAHIEPEHAKIIAPYLTHYETPEEQLRIEALIKHPDRPGRIAEIVCRKPRNLLYNWREFLVKAGVNWTGPVFAHNKWACIGAGLKTIVDLWQGAEIRLAQDHAKVVDALWIWNAGTNPVTLQEIEPYISEEIPETRLLEVLQELAALHILSLESGRIRKIDQLYLR